MGRCSKYSNYLPLPYFLIGIVNFPNGNFDNFDLRPPGSVLPDILKAVNNFELKSDCIVEGISLKRKRIEAGIASRDALDRVTIRAVLPE